MSHSFVYSLLKTLNIPVAYDHFDSDKKVSPPFIAYREQDLSTFKADNKVFNYVFNFEVELVTTKKDVALEEAITDLLTENNIPYDKTEEIWDDEEKIYHIFYEI